MKKILILCTGNSCRSQMAEGFFNSLEKSFEVYSAGTVPAKRVHPLAIEVMAESGIDISGYLPKGVGGFRGMDFDYVITVCEAARETCPVFEGKVGQRLHLGFSDPAEARGTRDVVRALFRQVRDEIIREFTDFYEDRLR